MKTMYRTLALQALLATAVIWGYSADAMATLVYTNQNSTTNTGAFDASISATDLVNQSTSTLLSQSNSGWNWGSDTNSNDGSASTNISGTPGSAYGSFGSSPTATFNLNISVNTLGYDIAEIHSFAGYTAGFARNYGNQLYNIEYQFLDNTWTSPVTVDYQPFTDKTSGNSGESATYVKMTDSSGTIVSGIKAIKISIQNNGGWDGIILKEFDVIGTPTVVPEPSSFAMLLFGSVMLWVVRKKRSA